MGSNRVLVAGVEQSDQWRLNASAQTLRGRLPKLAFRFYLGVISLAEEIGKAADEERVKEEEFFKQHEALTERYRHLTSSEIIQRAVLVEQALENLVASHFIGADFDKYLPFRSLMFQDGRVDFSDKIKMVKKLLKNEYPLIYEQVSPMFSKLDKTRELRNKFAHSKIVAPGYGEKELYMESYRDGKVVKEVIDSEENKQTIYEATGCQFLVMKIGAEIQRCNAIGKKMPLLPNLVRFFRERWPTLFTEEKPKEMF